MKQILEDLKTNVTGGKHQEIAAMVQQAIDAGAALDDIGKNLVAMMLEGAGFEVIDLGVDTTVESVIKKIDEIQPDVLGLSALLTTTMPEMQKVIEELQAKGIREWIRVMVGGAPVSARFAQDIGADAFGKDAAEAVSVARGFIGQR